MAPRRPGVESRQRASQCGRDGRRGAPRRVRLRRVELGSGGIGVRAIPAVPQSGGPQSASILAPPYFCRAELPWVRGHRPAEAGSIAGAGSPPLREFLMANPPLGKDRDSKLVRAAGSPPRSFLATLPEGRCCQREGVVGKLPQALTPSSDPKLGPPSSDPIRCRRQVRESSPRAPRSVGELIVAFVDN